MNNKLILGTLIITSFFINISVANAARYKFSAKDLCYEYGYISETYLGNNRSLEYYTCRGVGQFSPSHIPIIACTSDGCLLIDVVRQ